MARIKVAGLALALTLGVASVSAAQTADKKHDGHGKAHAQQMQRGGRGFQQLLKGIDLSDAQKTQLKQLREKQRDEFQKSDRSKEDRTKLTVEQRKERREQSFAAVRSILTQAQREVFDRNVAEQKTKFQKRGGEKQRRA
ncbi:MAG TPA: hypothetical protein VM100_07500 [Longimicrobiales bacterium]|nr:hypothetical protein [Longimicrobiales bacterium]